MLDCCAGYLYTNAHSRQNEMQSIGKKFMRTKNNYTTLLYAVVVSAILLSGCTSTTHVTTNYLAPLNSVEKPEKAEERYGKSTIEKVREEGKDKYQFEDELVKVTWLPSKTQFLTQIENKSEHSIKIVWDQGAYVDPEGSTCGIVHGEVRGTDIGNPVPPTVIPSQAKVSKTIFPECNIEWSGRGWNFHPLVSGFPESDHVPKVNVDSEVIRIKEEAEEFKGKTFRVLLPLEIKGTINEYTFVFELSEVVVEAEKE